jgi:hypothetical protein
MPTIDLALCGPGIPTTKTNQKHEIDIMKTPLTVKLSLLAALLLGGITLAPAADRYHFNFSLSGNSTNDARALVTKSASKSGMLRDVSAETSIPVAALAVIFERSSGRVLVVDREFGTNVSVVVRLNTDLSVGNTNQTRAALFMQVDHPNQANLSGSAVATVSIRRNALGEEISYKISGKIHVAIEEQTGDPTQIYSGVFSTGAVFTPRQ